MSWGEAFGHAVGMWASLFVVGIVFAIPAAIGFSLAVNGNAAGFALILASALAYQVCMLAIVVKGVSDATNENAVIREIRASERRIQRDYRPATSVARRPSPPRRSVALRKSVLAQESNHVADGTVAASVKYDPNAAIKIGFEPVPPLRFSVSRNGSVELEIDCGEGVSWTVSQIGGNVRLAIHDGSGVGIGIAKLRCDSDELYALTVSRIAMVRIEFDNGDKIGRTVDCHVAP